MPHVDGHVSQDSYEIYTAINDVAQTYAFSFPSASQTDIKVRVDGVIYASTSEEYPFTLQQVSSAPITDSGGTLTFSDAAKLPTAGTDFRVERVTDIAVGTGTGGLPINFTDGSILTEADLDKNFNALLYKAQEDSDAGSMFYTTDGVNWDAQGKQIKNVADASEDQDAVTFSQLKNVQLYGAPTVPQMWSFPATSPARTVLNLTSPVPEGIQDNFYFVSVGGLVQNPLTDFDISGTDQAGYICTLNETTALEVIVRNLGISRQFIGQPLLAEDTTIPTLHLKRIVGQTSKVVQFADENGTNVLTVDEDGMVTLQRKGYSSQSRNVIELGAGAGTGRDKATNPSALSLGYHTADGSAPTNQGAVWAGVSKGGGADENGTIWLIGKAGAGSTEYILKAIKNGVDTFTVKWDGSVDTVGSIAADGNITCYDFTASHFATAYYFEGTSAAGSSFYDGSAGGGGMQGSQNSSNNGMLDLSSEGPSLSYKNKTGAIDEDGHSDGNRGPKLHCGPLKISIVHSGTSLVQDGDVGLDMNSLRVENLSNPVGDQDAATKNYVDVTAVDATFNLLSSLSTRKNYDVGDGVSPGEYAFAFNDDTDSGPGAGGYPQGTLLTIHGEGSGWWSDAYYVSEALGRPAGVTITCSFSCAGSWVGVGWANARYAKTTNGVTTSIPIYSELSTSGGTTIYTKRPGEEAGVDLILTTHSSLDEITDPDNGAGSGVVSTLDAAISSGHVTHYPLQYGTGQAGTQWEMTGHNFFKIMMFRVG